MKTTTALQFTFISLFLVFAACEQTKGPAQTTPAPEMRESLANTSDAESSSEQDKQDEQPLQSVSSSADQLVNDFNGISGKKKLVMILSPT